MSQETGPTARETLDISRRIKFISQLEALEQSGVHVDGFAKTIDPTSVGAFAKEVAQIHQEKLDQEITIEHHTFAQRFRILTRRQSRRTAGTLMNRPSHHSRKRR